MFISRGVVQISAYVDLLLASYLADGRDSRAVDRADALHAAGQSVRNVGVGGRAAGNVQRARRLRVSAIARLNAGLRQIAFFIVPSAMGFLALGDVITAALFRDGPLHALTTRAYVWGILAGSAVGLLASTLGRLYSSTYYALRDTRTPLRFAVVRVVLTTGLGYLFAIPLPQCAGDRSAMGRRRPDRVRRNRRVGRVRAAAALAQSAHRHDGTACGLDGAPLDLRRNCGGSGLGREAYRSACRARSRARS